VRPIRLGWCEQAKERVLSDQCIGGYGREPYPFGHHSGRLIKPTAGGRGKLAAAVAELTVPVEADADATPAAMAERIPVFTAPAVVAALGGATPASWVAPFAGDAGLLGAADESLAVAANGGAALEITLSSWIVEPVLVAEFPGVGDDDAASRAADCAAGEMTFTAPLRGADAAPARGAIPARPSVSGAMWSTDDGAAPSGVCANAAKVDPKIPITEKYANPRIGFGMESSSPVVSKPRAGILSDILSI
jgi:hypothetical protein